MKKGEIFKKLMTSSPKLNRDFNQLQNILELMSNYSNVAGHKVNIHKSAAFLYINSEKWNLELKNTLYFTLALPK